MQDVITTSINFLSFLQPSWPTTVPCQIHKILLKFLFIHCWYFPWDGTSGKSSLERNKLLPHFTLAPLGDAAVVCMQLLLVTKLCKSLYPQKRQTQRILWSLLSSSPSSFVEFTYKYFIFFAQFIASMLLRNKWKLHNGLSHCMTRPVAGNENAQKTLFSSSSCRNYVWEVIDVSYVTHF